MFKWFIVLVLGVFGLMMTASDVQAQRFVTRTPQGVLLQSSGGRLFTVSEREFALLKAQQRQRQLAFELERQRRFSRSSSLFGPSRLGIRSSGFGVRSELTGLALDFFTLRELDRGNFGRALILDRFFR